MDDFETRTRNVKMFLKLALAGFLFTFFIPWIIFILQPSVAVFFHHVARSNCMDGQLLYDVQSIQLRRA